MSTPGAVVVAVDGSEADRAAIRYGAAEARRQGSDLMLVHVIPTFVPLSPTMPVLDADLEEMGQEVLAHAADTARAFLDGGNPMTTLRKVSRAAELLHQAESAEMLLLTRRPHAFPRGHLGGTGRALLRSAHCPVEVLPWVEHGGLG